MYRKHHNEHLSIEEFHMPFGGSLDPENRWLLFTLLMPWEELEETYAPQFNPNWRSCNAYTTGVWCAFHQAEAWLNR